MNKIQYVKGDATNPIYSKNRFIVHVCNDIGLWGKGFVLAVSKKWPEPEAAYHSLAASGLPMLLGEIQTVPVQPSLWVINLIAQRGVRSVSNPKPIKYWALEKALKELAADYAISMDASIHMPRIGCGLGGGRWSEIEPIINETLIKQGLDVVVYDLER